MTGWDERAMRTFQFNMDRPDDDWFWQREFVEWMWDNNRTIVLKARQLGITWLAAGHRRLGAPLPSRLARPRL